MLKVLFIFSIFSIVGWILELFYRSIKSKRIINPGFMSGPVVPLYGFGAVILNIICSSFNGIFSSYKIIFIYLFALILLSTLEYITGFILYKIFHLKLWDYSEYKYNLNGFICLRFLLLWGLLSLIYYTFIFNYINNFIANTSSIHIFLLGMFYGLFLVDLVFSIDLFNRVRKHAKEIRIIVDIEKLKLELLLESKKKFINTILPLQLIKKYIIDKNR